MPHKDVVVITYKTGHVIVLDKDEALSTIISDFHRIESIILGSYSI